MGGAVLALGALVAYLLARWSMRVAARSGGFQDRRMLVLCALLAPGLVVGTLLGGSVAMVLEGCPFFQPFDQILVWLVAAGFLAFVGVACARHAGHVLRVRRELREISEPVTEGPLWEALSRLSASLGIRHPELRVARTSEPLACSLGLGRPTVILSSGLIAMLDEGEREAVLAHELAHLKQNDHVVGFLVAWLRDGLFYMPTAREAWDRYAHDREIACDALSASTTGRPGALASALFKVCTGHGAIYEHVAHFGHEASHLETRLSHLVGDNPPAPGSRAIVGYGVLALGVMAVIMALSPVWYLPLCMTVICRL